MKKSRAALAEEAANATREPRTPKQELLLKRRNRRKVDFKTLAGVARESTRNYLDIINGAVSFDQGELRGRAISRHREILMGMVQQSQLADLVQELQSIREAGKSPWQAHIDLDDQPLPPEAMLEQDE